VFRLLDGFRSIGPDSLASKKRGKPSNNRLHRAVRQLTMMLVRQYYADFGPTLACEKLREQHDCRVGELIQIDGSTHQWFENRGGKCTLLAYIDDATSRIQHAAFVPSESAFDYMRETRASRDA
jgi:hypothetical protein